MNALEKWDGTYLINREVSLWDKRYYVEFEDQELSMPKFVEVFVERGVYGAHWRVIWRQSAVLTPTASTVINCAREGRNLYHPDTL